VRAVRLLCALLWFIGATFMVLTATYIWAYIIVAAIKATAWPVGALLAIGSLWLFPRVESYLLYPWQRWLQLWQHFDSVLSQHRLTRT
jgi:hypothetical protein